MDDKIKYCPMDMESFDLSNLSGFVTSDFDGDGLMDIAGYNLERIQMEIFYNLSPYPEVTNLCQDLIREDDDVEILKTRT